jgi:transcriptional regulator of acetoin/glycerol metabolism
LAPAARAVLRRHDWPGNLRELANLLRTLVALAAPGTVLGLDDLPADIQGAKPAGEPDLDTLRDEALGRALERHRGNVSAAARALGVHRSTLYRRIGRR